jgi:hypothetical protein
MKIYGPFLPPCAPPLARPIKRLFFINHRENSNFRSDNRATKNKQLTLETDRIM